MQFCRFLRQQGFAVSVHDEATALQAIGLIEYDRRDVFKIALKAVLCKSYTQLNEFDILFDQYWKELEQAVDSKIKKKQQPVVQPNKKDVSFKSLKAWLNGNKSNEV